MRKQALFIQGGGQEAYEADEELAASLRDALGPAYEVQYPKMSEAAGPDYGAWCDRLTQELAALDGEATLVGHSLGASVLLKYLSEERVESDLVAGLFLVAAPCWGVEDWEIGEYELAADFASKLPAKSPIFFYHSRDDEVVPFSHLALYKTKLPQAVFRELNGRGHQFDGDLSVVARDIHNL